MRKCPHAILHVPLWGTSQQWVRGRGDPREAGLLGAPGTRPVFVVAVVFPAVQLFLEVSITFKCHVVHQHTLYGPLLVFTGFFEKQMDRQRGRARKSSHLLVHSPNACNSEGRARMKPGAGNSLRCPWVAGTQDLCCPHRPQGLRWQSCSQEPELGGKPRRSHAGVGSELLARGRRPPPVNPSAWWLEAPLSPGCVPTSGVIAQTCCRTQCFPCLWSKPLVRWLPCFF